MIDMITNFVIEFRLWEGEGMNRDDHRYDKRLNVYLGSPWLPQITQKTDTCVKAKATQDFLFPGISDHPLTAAPGPKFRRGGQLHYANLSGPLLLRQ